MEYVNTNTPNTSRSTTGAGTGAENANQIQANPGEGPSSGSRISPIFVSVDIYQNRPNPGGGPSAESMAQDLRRISSVVDAYENQANPGERPSLESLKRNLNTMNSQIHLIPDRATKESLYIEIGRLVYRINSL